jgi:hypothetical protein
VREVWGPGLADTEASASGPDSKGPISLALETKDSWLYTLHLHWKLISLGFNYQWPLTVIIILGF